jgi:peroxiredoxin/outer membrane lipoprotein-sorting protein
MPKACPMGRIRIPFVLTLPAFALCLSAQTPAADVLLKKVSETYASLKNYHFEVRATKSLSSPGRYVAPEESRVVLAVAAPDRLHFEIRAPLNQQITVSDGTTTWTYLPQYKQYTKEDGALSEAAEDAEETEDEQSQDPVAMARYQLISRFQNLTPEGKSVQFLSDDEIEVGGEKIRCAVVQVTQEANGILTGQGLTVEQLWIDPKRYLVLKSVLKAKRNIRNSLAGVTETREWTKVRVGQELDESLFSFQPPRGVKLVQVLDTPFKRADWRGKSATDFTLKSLDGDDVSLSGLRGKVVLITFWASWCPPCRNELPVLVNLESELRARGLVVLGINDERGNAARNFLQSHGLALRTLNDAKHAVHRLYGVHSIPTLLVLDREGTVVGHYRGGIPENTIRASLKQAGVQ